MFFGAKPDQAEREAKAHLRLSEPVEGTRGGLAREVQPRRLEYRA
jgi:hypothetical protein